MICCGDGGWHEGFYTLNMSDNIKYRWVGGQPHRGRRGQPGGEDHGVKGEMLSRLDYAIMWPQPSYQLLRKTQWIYNRHFIIRYYEQTETRRCNTLDSASDKNCLFLHFLSWRLKGGDTSWQVFKGNTKYWSRRSLTLGCITLVGIFFKKDLIWHHSDDGWYESCLYFEHVWQH